MGVHEIGLIPSIARELFLFIRLRRVRLELADCAELKLSLCGGH